MGKFYERIAKELTLYVRQLAWLYAAPENPKGDKSEPISRIKHMQASDIDPALPPISAPWLVEYLMEIGPVVAAGMGAGPISWRDIADWQQVTGMVLQPWEARAIKRMSSEYLAEMREAEKPERPAPWISDEEIAANRDAVNRKVSNAFKAFSLANKGMGR